MTLTETEIRLQTQALCSLRELFDKLKRWQTNINKVVLEEMPIKAAVSWCAGENTESYIRECMEWQRKEAKRLEERDKTWRELCEVITKTRAVAYNMEVHVRETELRRELGLDNVAKRA